ncbi:fatty-acyl coenzyme A oxidase [Lodderomyces elongisporus]|uniref:Acyl-coenzyme A oxidase n=1 Tax=Lodderomyces elongisporus (strain ATCC 11503 / CBS 2605 / JCM 1781 / NBRC 1676 / NRRL YB-4239) TaxID=379508 RepID=A5DZZ4_LODEL|nr:fatty-acyl coenzyme A oxidase [Lodderomyces elongisporus]EDK44752.1 acyl-coenzyme A oxidase 4 [Lodderomyces elongisporus NRRL YB-4239]WLF79990.1 fatty-acyl coenzyme A oxidase [Lodderomyces elongisporus]
MVFTQKTVSLSQGPDPRTSIQKERAEQKFDPQEMQIFLEGSKERAELIKSLVQQMERDPILWTDGSYYDMTKEQLREQTALKINRVSRYLETDSIDVFNRRLSIIGVFDPSVTTRIGVNLGLFISCIRGNGTYEQLKYWALDKETAHIKGIYGCFGMTELAHGSNVMGLETTATFDKDNDEFIINTPHIGATKWWIGGAAHSATHCTVYARLIVDGEDYGVKTFVVPLRDSNHDLMPGVTVGDIGAKMGRDGIDNGWIQFSSVRIPRFFMLQKFCKVDRDGDVILPPLEQLSYSALLGGRVMMVMDSYRMLARVSTIALRYAIGRRQFKGDNVDPDDEEALETQLLDYPLHQKRLLPYLAAAYVVSAGALEVERTIEATLLELDDAVDENDEAGIMKAIDAMKSLFIDSGSLKSTCTWLAAEAIDQCRQACGGHGYSAYNGFGKAYNDWVVQCTWEGDNNVLGINIGKPLVKHVIAIEDDGKVVKGSSDFLNQLKEFTGKEGSEKVILDNAADIEDVKKVIKAIEVAIIRASYTAGKTVREKSFDYVGAELVIISKLKAHHYLLTEYVKRIDEFDQEDKKPYLYQLAQLYGATIVLDKFAGTFLAYNVISTKATAELASQVIPKLCSAIRPNVVGLTDSFQQSDMMINAPIGRYDGDIYENYFDLVKVLNPPKNHKAPYSAALEAMLNRPSLSERERFEKSLETGEILSK